MSHLEVRSGVTTTDKFLRMGLAIVVFFAVVGVILFLASRFKGRRADRWVALAFLAPTFLLVTVGLIYPGVRTIFQSFQDAAGTSFIGLDNYTQIFTDAGQRKVLRNTFFWVVVTPFVATAIGLVYAILIDKARFESFAKALIFLPMAISFVGASIIWRFVYEYRPNQVGVNQTGLLNQLLVWIGLEPVQFLLNAPVNNLFLIAVMIWIQTGFAMTSSAPPSRRSPTTSSRQRVSTGCPGWACSGSSPSRASGRRSSWSSRPSRWAR